MRKKMPFSAAFKELGMKYRHLRIKKRMVQEDVLEYGFSVRHYQQLESGRPHSLTTLLRIAEMYEVDPADLLEGIGWKEKSSEPKTRENGD